MFWKRKDRQPPPAPREVGSAADIDETVGTLKVVEEQLAVGKIAVPGSTTRVHIETDTTQEHVEAMLRREEYDIETVTVGEVVSAIPRIRKEGDVTVIPVCEERLVVRKEVILREEIRLTPRHTVESYEDTVELRRQHAVIETLPAE